MKLGEKERYLQSLPTIDPVSSIVEHSTDNRKTEERYLYWIPAAFVDMVITLV